MVISIIAILIGILVPALGRARTMSKGLKCLTGLRTYGQATQMYIDANKDYFPISTHTTAHVNDLRIWRYSLMNYGLLPSLLKCPMDPYKDDPDRAISYASNEHFEIRAPGIDYNPVTRKTLPGGRERSHERFILVPRPSVTIHFYETNGSGDLDHLNTHAFQDAGELRASLAVTRHLQSAHFNFADGHAEPVTWASLSGSFSPQTSPFDPDTAR